MWSLWERSVHNYSVSVYLFYIPIILKDTGKKFSGPSARQIVQDRLKSKLAVDDLQKNWDVFVLFKEVTVQFKEKSFALLQVCGLS